jgi:hypothetical protein
MVRVEVRFTNSLALRAATLISKSEITPTSIRLFRLHLTLPNASNTSTVTIKAGSD